MSDKERNVEKTHSYRSEKRHFEKIVHHEELRTKTDFIKASKLAPFINLIMYVFMSSTRDNNPAK